MKKYLILGIILGFVIGSLTAVSATKYYSYWEYDFRGRNVDKSDLSKAKINIAIALEQIANEGLKLKIEK